MRIFICEMIGTAMLLLLGNGVNCNVSLNKSGQKGGGSVQTGLAWGLAVLLPAFIFGKTTGAHFNPAVTLALAVEGSVKTSDIPYYLCGQFIGAFIGAAIVILLFYDHFKATDDPSVKLGCFATGGTIRNTFLNFTLHQYLAQEEASLLGCKGYTHLTRGGNGSLVVRERSFFHCHRFGRNSTIGY